MILYQYPTRLHYSSIAYGQRQQFDLFGIPIQSIQSIHKNWTTTTLSMYVCVFLLLVKTNTRRVVRYGSINLLNGVRLIS